MNSMVTSFTSLVIIFLLAYGILYFSKPNFVQKDGKFSMEKGMLYSLLIALILSILVFIVTELMKKSSKTRGLGPMRYRYCGRMH